MSWSLPYSCPRFHGSRNATREMVLVHVDGSQRSPNRRDGSSRDRTSEFVEAEVDAPWIIVVGANSLALRPGLRSYVAESDEFDSCLP